MVPALRPGRIIVAVAWPVRLKQGDVIIFSHDGIEKVKRIHALQDGRLTVKGDNKFGSIDSRHFGEITFDDVIAKVVLPAS